VLCVMYARIDVLETALCRQLPTNLSVFGGKTVVTLEIGVSIVLILMGLLQLHW